MSEVSLPLLGFAAWSGSGKTTLLTKVIALLKEKGLRVGVIKHSHHHFDIDQPGKDSYALREAGSAQVIIASRQRLASIIELPEARPDPQLQDALSMIQVNRLDIILVEGFKDENIAKIEIHRKELDRPYLYPHDKQVIALVEDHPEPGTTPTGMPHLDLNKPAQIVEFIEQWLSNVQKESK